MRNWIPAVFALAALAGVPSAYAADDDMSGVEMDVVDPRGTPNDASTKTLTLPEAASDTGRDHAQAGLDKANAAREGGREFGRDTADAAHENHGAQGGDHGPGDHGKPETPGRP